VRDHCEVSWGRAEFFFQVFRFLLFLYFRFKFLFILILLQEKITPVKR
jgi:hypothetical protein